MNYLSKIFNKTTTNKKDQVVFDDVEVIRTMRDGRQESVRWDELQEVRIVTTDQGPLVDDVYWLLIGTKSGCAVPSQVEGVKELLTRLQELPNFNNREVINAMSSAQNAQFVCWVRSVASESQA